MLRQIEKQPTLFELMTCNDPELFWGLPSARPAPNLARQLEQSLGGRCTFPGGARRIHGRAAGPLAQKSPVSIA